MSETPHYAPPPTYCYPYRKRYDGYGKDDYGNDTGYGGTSNRYDERYRGYDYKRCYKRYPHPPPVFEPDAEASTEQPEEAPETSEQYPSQETPEPRQETPTEPCDPGYEPDNGHHPGYDPDTEQPYEPESNSGGGCDPSDPAC
jgi:hypothetical protein